MGNIANKVLKPKLGLLELAKQLGNVSKACKVMGYSRDTFYRYQEMYENGGELALQEISRKKANPKNRVPEHIEQAVITIATEYPAYGQERAANELRQQGIDVSGSGVRSIWLRNDLESLKKRLQALEAKVAQEGIILTEEQIQALEKSRAYKEAHGEIETEHPGFLGSQDTYYVGYIKGVGHIYQQTFIDTYSRYALAKLYTSKTAIAAADMLNDKVLPWFNSQGINLQRVLTDRGTEYCGKVEHHAYELYLAVEDIDHSKTKAYSPQTNGIVERLHKTMKDEFYSIIFRKKIITTIESLQADLDVWLKQYNTLRPHSGKYCYGKTPLQTFEESKHIAFEKQIVNNVSLSDNATNLTKTG